MEIEINERLASKVKDVVSYGLVQGLGVPELGEMCVEAAVNYACGLPHGDNPSCVGSAVRAFKIKLNDAIWSSNDARAKGMLKIAIGQLGSNVIDQAAFAQIVAFKTVTVLMPVILIDNGFNTEATLCENSKDIREARYNISQIRNRLRPAYSSSTTIYVAKIAASYAYTSSTIIYAGAAAVAAANTAAVAAAAANRNYITANDKYLNISANICLEALIELKSPGCEFLYLCD